MSPPNMPLWRIDYFECDVLQKQLGQEGPSGPPVSLRRQEMHVPREMKGPFLYRGVEGGASAWSLRNHEALTRDSISSILLPHLSNERL